MKIRSPSIRLQHEMVHSQFQTILNIEYLLYQEYLKRTNCQKPKWPKHESFGALTESAIVSILLHAQAA